MATKKKAPEKKLTRAERSAKIAKEYEAKKKKELLKKSKNFDARSAGIPRVKPKVKKPTERKVSKKIDTKRSPDKEHKVGALNRNAQRQFNEAERNRGYYRSNLAKKSEGQAAEAKKYAGKKGQTNESIAYGNSRAAHANFEELRRTPTKSTPKEFAKGDTQYSRQTDSAYRARAEQKKRKAGEQAKIPGSDEYKAKKKQSERIAKEKAKVAKGKKTASGKATVRNMKAAKARVKKSYKGRTR